MVTNEALHIIYYCADLWLISELIFWTVKNFTFICFVESQYFVFSILKDLLCALPVMSSVCKRQLIIAFKQQQISWNFCTVS